MPIDSEQLAKLVEDHWASLIDWVSIASGSQSVDAEEVVQEAYIRLATQEELPDRPVAWLFTVARRLSANRRLADNRRAKRERSAFLGKTLSNAGKSATKSEATDELQEVLMQLDEQERQVVFAKLWSNLTWDEIAFSLQLSKTTVWRLYKRAIQRLKVLYNKP